MKQQKDFYEKPKLTEVEFDFNEAVCKTVRISKCLTVEPGTGVHSHGGFLEEGGSTWYSGATGKKVWGEER